MPLWLKFLATGTLLVPVTVALLAGCGGSESSGPPERNAPPPADVTTVDVSGHTLWLQKTVVDGVTCIVGVGYAHGNPVLSCDWSSTPTPTPSP